jgi:hypothetical protein
MSTRAGTYKSDCDRRCPWLGPTTSTIGESAKANQFLHEILIRLRQCLGFAIRRDLRRGVLSQNAKPGGEIETHVPFGHGLQSNFGCWPGCLWQRPQRRLLQGRCSGVWSARLRSGGHNWNRSIWRRIPRRRRGGASVLISVLIKVVTHGPKRETPYSRLGDTAATTEPRERSCPCRSPERQSSADCESVAPDALLGATRARPSSIQAGGGADVPLPSVPRQSPCTWRSRCRTHPSAPRARFGRGSGCDLNLSQVSESKPSL